MKHYTYRTVWSPEDEEYVGLCAEFPSLSWLALTPETALAGVRKLVDGVILDMESSGEILPEALSDKSYSGKFMVRVTPETHRNLAIQASEQGVSLNRLISARLCN